MTQHATATSAREGNTLAVRHGAQSDSIVTAEMPAAVAHIRDILVDQLPFLGPGDELLIERAARLQIQLRMIDGYLDRLGGSLIDKQGRPRRCWPMYTNLNHQLRETLKQLGVGPAVRAQMAAGLSSGGNLASQLADYRRSRS